MLVKEILGIEIKLMSGRIPRLQKAKHLAEKERLEKEFEKDRQSNQKTIAGICKGIWQDFKEACMAMSRAEGKMSFKDIETLSVTDYYLLKAWLLKNKPQGRTTTNTDER